jgi:alkylation response protein AidB-like acyl-CoA dehydrogenase
VIRAKLAEMVRLIEGAHDNLERVAYQFSCGVKDSDMGGPCALLKVQASRIMELCAREAAQIFGGASVVREGQGKMIERIYREVRAAAIPGGSEEILMDFAIRQAMRKASSLSKM